MSGKSGVDAVEMPALRLRKNGMEANQGRKIIERHFGENLLLNEWALFSMKVRQCQGVLQVSERCLDSPAFVVKYTEQRRGEAVCWKVGDHSLVQAIFDRKSDHAEGDGIQRIACVFDIIETNLAGNPTVFLRLPADTVGEAFGQEIAEDHIEFRCIRQLGLPLSSQYSGSPFHTAG